MLSILKQMNINVPVEEMPYVTSQTSHQFTACRLSMQSLDIRRITQWNCPVNGSSLVMHLGCPRMVGIARE